MNRRLLMGKSRTGLAGVFVRISPIVETWKGMTKYVSLAASRLRGGDRLLLSPHRRAQQGLGTGCGKSAEEEDRRGADRMMDGQKRRDSANVLPDDVGPGDGVRQPPAPFDGEPASRPAPASITGSLAAISLVLLALSGYGAVPAELFFLTGLFGGAKTTRIIHPWIGVVLFFSFSDLYSSATAGQTM